MKIGDIVKVRQCPIPEVVGETAEIVDMQIQEFEKYTVYPVWVKMTSGEPRGKIYGFQYDEVEVMPKACQKDIVKMKVVEQLEEMLRAMKIGGMVKIKKCDSLPEVVGESAAIVDMQIQEFEKYMAYPVWVKMTSGERRGKVYGFQYEEVELPPRAYKETTMKTKVVKQLEEILSGVTTMEERGRGGAMKIGDIVKVRECPIPEVVGETAEIVDMQIQEFEKYTVYPVWVKMTSGEPRGKIYGFQYDEVEVMPKACQKDIVKMKVVEQLEEMLRAMKIGGMVKIKKCDSLPEVVGESAAIVDMQIQEFEKYMAYPVWVKMTSGERRGKVYGFQYDEVEVMPKAYAEKTTKTKVDEQLEEMLRGVTTMEEIAEIERAIDEIKGKVLAEAIPGFWEGKTPCWEMFRCPEAIRNECPAFKYRALPCWEIEGTYSKLHDYGQIGNRTDICRTCRVYKRWGHGEPIEIKLLGKGFNVATKAVPK